MITVKVKTINDFLKTCLFDNEGNLVKESGATIHPTKFHLFGEEIIVERMKSDNDTVYIYEDGFGHTYYFSHDEVRFIQ